MITFLAKHTETEEDLLIMMTSPIRTFAVTVNDKNFLNEINTTGRNSRPSPSSNSYCEHYKGDVYYTVDIAKNVTTGELLMVYGDLKGNMWARPEKMFFEHVEHNNKRVPRFKKINI